MASLTDYQREVLESLFVTRDLRSMWDVIYNEYESKHLGECIGDDEMIAEYTYITQQLRKYVSSHQDQIMDHGADFDAMLAEVENLLNTAGEYAKERKELVYSFLRDQWLIEIYNGIVWLMENSGEDEEEE